MCELLRTTDPVLVSFIAALLKEAEIAFHVADAGMAAVEGSIGAFPRRVLVACADFSQARRIACDAGLAREMPSPAGPV